MISAASTTVSILRGVGEDDYGDEVDLGQVAYSRVPAGITLARIAKTREDEHDPQAVHIYACRLPRRVQLQDGDRIRDDRTGSVYVVDKITGDQQGPLGFATDRNLELRRVR